MALLNLLYIMRLNGIADSDLAESIGVTEERFTACRLGRENFTKAEKLAIASILGMAASWLFERL